jgi:PAS domain S-box-containing protein
MSERNKNRSTSAVGRSLLQATERKQTRTTGASVPWTAVLDALPAHAAVLDPSGLIVFVNAAWRRFAAANGWQDEDCGLGLNYLDICARARGPDAGMAGQAAAGIRAVLNGRTPEFSLDYACHTPDEQHWFRLTVAPVGPGGAKGALTLHAEITAQYLTQQALSDYELRFRELAAAVDEVFWLTDLKSLQVLYVNSAYEAIWGRSCESLLANPGQWMEAIYTDDRARVEQAVSRLLGSGQFDVEYRILRPDGSLRWIRDRAYSIRDEAGKVRRAAGVARDITAAREAGEKIRHSEALLRIAGNAARLGGWTADPPDWRIQLSEPLRAMLGIPDNADLTLAQGLLYVASGSRSRLRKAFSDCVRRGLAFDGDWEVMPGSQQRRWVRVIGEALRGEDGRVFRVQGAVQDISDRQRAAEQERLLSKRLASMLESIPDPFIALDRRWNFTYVNAKAGRLMQRKPDELLGKQVWAEFPDIARSPVRRRLQRALRLGKPMRFRGFYPPLSIWVEVVAYPSDEGLAVFFENINAQKRGEQALRRSEDRFRQVAGITTDLIWEWDLDNERVLWSEGCQTRFGYSAGELKNLPWQQGVHPLDLDRVLTGIHAFVAGGADSWSAEYRFRRQDGSYAFVMDRGLLIRDAGGQPVSMVGGMTDQTERRLAEIKLAAHARDLERTNQELERFAHIASHDLKEPLRAVTSYAQLLARRYSGQGQAEVDEFAEVIVDSARRMRMLLDGLLEYSKVLRPESPGKIVSLGLALQQAQDRLQESIKASQAEIRCAGQLPDVPGDLELLSQLFEQLISNSLKFRSAEPPRMCFAARQELQGWLVTVSDNGVGIDPRNSERIFRLYQRMHTEGGQPGRGLGLALCRRIVEVHGGRIWNEPAERGARFLFLLPA